MLPAQRLVLCFLLFRENAGSIWSEEANFAGLILSLIGWLALFLLIGHASVGVLIACHVFYMIGIGLSYSNMMTTGMNALNEELQGDRNAMFNTLQQFSGAVATSLVAVIINYVQHHTSHNYEVSTTLGSKAALGVLLLLLLVSFARFAYYLFFAKSVDSIYGRCCICRFCVKMVVCKRRLFMEKIAIIGGGIIGMTLASYLDTSKFNVALFDEGTGQATKASAGIISLGCRNAETNNGIVWLKTALLFPKLIKDFQLDQTIYAQSGTLLLRPEKI